jgi:hypothetical protein
MTTATVTLRRNRIAAASDLAAALVVLGGFSLNCTTATFANSTFVVASDASVSALTSAVAKVPGILTCRIAASV